MHTQWGEELQKLKQGGSKQRFGHRPTRHKRPGQNKNRPATPSKQTIKPTTRENFHCFFLSRVSFLRMFALFPTRLQLAGQVASLVYCRHCGSQAPLRLFFCQDPVPCSFTCSTPFLCFMIVSPFRFSTAVARVLFFDLDTPSHPVFPNLLMELLKVGDWFRFARLAGNQGSMRRSSSFPSITPYSSK